MIRATAAAALLAIVAATPAIGQGALPDPTRTPGALNPEVRQDTIETTICLRGWTRTIRPPQQYTSALKRQQLRALRYPDSRMSDYEEDHLVPLALGGAPYDPRNLWPEPRGITDGWSAAAKDKLEVRLARMVCSGLVPLAEAQQEIASDWTAAYNRYVAGKR